MALDKRLKREYEAFATQNEVKKFKDLKLKKLLNKLDFAHFTYKDGMCTCCFTPMDFDAKYWKNEKIKTKYKKLNKLNSSEVDDKLQYILFRNADLTYVNLTYVIKYLETTLDDNYIVEKPKTEFDFINIVHKNYINKRL